MKRLSILSTGVGIVIGMLIATAIDSKYDLSQIDKAKEPGNIPKFYWNDRTNPPHRGFELKVDMYYNQTKDTIYMEYSSGPEGE